MKDTNVNPPNSKEPRIVEVWAPSCMECRAMEGDLQAVATEFVGRVSLEKVNAAADPDAVKQLGAMATPTLIGFAGGVELFRTIGRRSRSELTAAFTAAEAGQQARGLGRHDRILRVAAGASLAAIGALAGPAWPLLIVGAGIIGWGLASANGTRSA